MPVPVSAALSTEADSGTTGTVMTAPPYATTMVSLGRMMNGLPPLPRNCAQNQPLASLADDYRFGNHDVKTP